MKNNTKYLVIIGGLILIMILGTIYFFLNSKQETDLIVSNVTGNSHQVMIYSFGINKKCESTRVILTTDENINTIYEEVKNLYENVKLEENTIFYDTKEAMGMSREEIKEQWKNKKGVSELYQKSVELYANETIEAQESHISFDE